MDKYTRVEKPREEVPIAPNEIRVTTMGKTRSYITYATTLLQEKGQPEVVLKAMGRAINKTVTIAEIIKRRVAGLHQITAIGSSDITDRWEPLEEGLLPLETTRHVSIISITLSTNPLDSSSPGYQPPLPLDLVKPWANDEGEVEGEEGRRGRGPRSRGRGRRQAVHADEASGDAEAQTVRAAGGGRGRGRGQGRNRARGKGGRGVSGGATGVVVREGDNDAGVGGRAGAAAGVNEQGIRTSADGTLGNAASGSVVGGVDAGASNGGSFSGYQGRPTTGTTAAGAPSHIRGRGRERGRGRGGGRASYREGGSSSSSTGQIVGAVGETFKEGEAT